MSSFVAGRLPVRIFATHAEMARAAAAEAADSLRATLEQQGEARVILACAASQVQFLAALTAAPRIAWSRITVFHMDEYLGIAPDHPASFRRFLQDHVLRKIRPRRFCALCGEADQPLAVCADYARLLAEKPIDLCCLGIGENGHIAFNDPAVASFQDPHLVKLVKLDAACRRQQVGEGAFPTLAAVPEYAYTLTVPALCAARRLVCVVPERRKAVAVRRALRGRITPACPASYLRTQAHATLFLDAESAALLGRRTARRTTGPS